VAAASSIVFTVVLIVVIALGVQSHNDRVLGAQVAQSELELRTVGAQIAAISIASFAARLNRETRVED